MTLHRIGAALAASLLAGPAQAHSFASDGGFYARFVEGTQVVLAYPATLLPLLALGVLTTLWHRDGLLRAWPALIAGQVAGIGLGSVAAGWILPALMGIGAAVAILAALAPYHTATEVRIAAAVTGALAIGASLEGHGLFELPLSIHLGIFFAANLAVAVAAGLPRVTLDRWDAPWLRILWRVVASWIAAILILSLAVGMAR